MAVPGKDNLSALTREKAFELGFDLCGIAKARALDEYGAVLKSWCETGMSGDMIYLSRNIEKRVDPEFLFPGVKSLVVTGLNYFSENKQTAPGVPVLSRYAYGVNYHDVINAKLEKLLAYIKTIESKAEGRPIVDSAPLLEKEWAHEAGMGWQGKHSILINKETGSFFFIGTLLLNLELEYDSPFKGEYCRECRLCIDSCPTGAINNNRTIDARKCIANLTIENRGPIPEEIIPRLGGRVYGCDKCQEVCPWNKHAKSNLAPEFAINEEVAGMSRDDWQFLTGEQFTRLFKGSAVERVKYEHFIRNIRAALKSGL
ncbi:MAG: tRNA epoxyqueuosine(34) reductase QueG [Bacteroidales bacterium]|nr:tRNA epoxyqueuosine(34) reductase QueG [Bacteroidales bacterium]